VDEATVKLDFPLQQCWMRRGQQRRLPATRYQDTHQRQRFIGAYNWSRDTVVVEPVEHVNSDSFIHFLDHLFTHVYPEQPVVLVLDNASYHHTAAVQAAYSLVEPRVQVVFLPPYCPELNAIERYWRHLKHLVCANTLHRSLAALVADLRQAVDLQNHAASPHRFQSSKDFQ
jgi:transposase